MPGSAPDLTDEDMKAFRGDTANVREHLQSISQFAVGAPDLTETRSGLSCPARS
jgi:hypothetical protein